MFRVRNHLHALIVGRWAIQAMAQPRPYFVPSPPLLAARQTGYFSAILLKSNAADAQTAYASRTMRIAKSARWRRHRFNETNLRFRPGASPINRPHPGAPHSGIMNLNQLGTLLPNGEAYRPHEVQVMMEQLWAEYVNANPRLFDVHD